MTPLRDPEGRELRDLALDSLSSGDENRDRLHEGGFNFYDKYAGCQIDPSGSLSREESSERLAIIIGSSNVFSVVFPGWKRTPWTLHD